MPQDAGLKVLYAALLTTLIIGSAYLLFNYGGYVAALFVSRLVHWFNYVSYLVKNGLAGAFSVLAGVWASAWRPAVAVPPAPTPVVLASGSVTPQVSVCGCVVVGDHLCVTAQMCVCARVCAWCVPMRVWIMRWCVCVCVMGR